MQGQTSGQVGGSISDPERGYQIRFALEAEDAVQDTAGVTVTVMQGAKSESVKSIRPFLSRMEAWCFPLR